MLEESLACGTYIDIGWETCVTILTRENIIRIIFIVCVIVWLWRVLEYVNCKSNIAHINTNAVLGTFTTMLVNIVLSVDIILWDRRVSMIWKIVIVWNILIIRDVLRTIEIMRITVEMACIPCVCVNIIKLLRNIEHHWVKYNVTYNDAHLLHERPTILVISKLEVVKHDGAEYSH